MASTSHAPLHIYLRDSGAILSTRERGRRAAEQLRALTEEPGDIILDFAGVEAATPPFLQEVIDAAHSVILKERETTGRILVGVNMNDDLAGTMTFVLN